MTDENEPIRVIVVDDHDLLRKGVRDLLTEHGLRVVGEAADGADAVRLVAHAAPDVVVMDLNMPRMSGIEATRRLSMVAPASRVLVLTVSADDETVAEAIEAGASGYLLKDASGDEIASGVRAAAAGEALISPRIAARVLERMRPPGGGVGPGAGGAELTDREVEVLRLLSAGRDNAAIAQELFISPRTVKNHISSILAKLHVDNRIQAAVYAVRKGLV
jgi:two-component system, NarL family, response regulator LiaR